MERLGGLSASLQDIITNDCVGPASSNIGYCDLPFQRWMKFKEAFSPRFVAQTIEALPFVPRHCVDPFGGSGTTALTCSLLGIASSTVEVNPFLVDLIKAKLFLPGRVELKRAYSEVMSKKFNIDVKPREVLPNAPSTFFEPGSDGRFVFWLSALKRILELRIAIEEISSSKTRRVLKVLLGGILVQASNVVVNGKGRRYRRGWTNRPVGRVDVDELFAGAVARCVEDIESYGAQIVVKPRVLAGDSRRVISSIGAADVAIFSPPYPNSFDYTDVYNLELWVLGYLSSRAQNRRLRRATLRSHVQIEFDRSVRNGLACSSMLMKTVKALRGAEKELWDGRIPDMLLGYFDDMRSILISLADIIRVGGRIIMVVGDSCYAGVQVNVAEIISDLIPNTGFRIISTDRIRSMRKSAQHGGQHELPETCLLLERHQG